MAELNVTATGENGRPARILLIEDNPGDAVLTRKAFTSLKFTNEITLAEDADKALDILKNGPKPDLILLDINLPGKGGIFLLEEIKQNQNLRGIPVFMLTSSKVSTDIHASYDLDAASYIVKPLTLDKLGPALSKLSHAWCCLMVADKG